MVAPVVSEFFLPDEDSARRFGAALGLCLTPGTTVLLEGPLGAGKSHIARAAIRARMGEATEVPSPTFTLVQTYEGDGDEIWHADLYRLTDPGEVEELGLPDAMKTAIVLIEWPDRLGSLRPEGAAVLTLAHDGDGRRVRLSCPPGLAACLAAGGWR